MVCTHDHPLVETQQLDEMYYKTMMQKIVPGYLPTRDYAPLIKFVKYQKTVGNTIQFFVPNRYNGFMVYIRFDEWAENVRDLEYTPVEAARLLFWGANLRIHCNCPSFAFHGYQYILSQTESAIVPEVRFPHVRNPHLKGLLCKHGRRVMKTLPFHLGDMAKAIKEQRAAL
jgi:hypothetical protein